MFEVLIRVPGMRGWVITLYRTRSAAQRSVDDAISEGLEAKFSKLF